MRNILLPATAAVILSFSVHAQTIKQIANYPAAGSVGSTDKVLLQQGVLGTAYTYGTLGQIIGLPFPNITFTGSSIPANGLYLPSASTLGMSAASTQVATLTSTIFSIKPSTASTTSATGALTVAGGVGVAGNIYSAAIVSGARFVPSGSTVPTDGVYLPSASTLGLAAGSTQIATGTSTVITIPMSTAASNATTGALVVTGGVGIGGNLYVTGSPIITGSMTVNNQLTANRFIPSNSTVPTNGIYLPSANTVGFSANSTQIATMTSTVLKSVSTTASTTSTTGALQSAGGLGVAGDIYAGASINSGTSVTATTLVRGANIVTGASSLTLTTGAVGLSKMTASASAPGAGGAKMELVCGTNAGTAKVIVYAGTSTTAVTIADNIGSGVTGC